MSDRAALRRSLLAIAIFAAVYLAISAIVRPQPRQ